LEEKKMNTRANLKEVFDDCDSKHIYVNLDDNYCTTTESEKASKGYIGRIYAPQTQSIERIMEDLDEEGSADISWCFEGPNLAKVGDILNQIFRKKGYFAEWGKGKTPEISAVIEEEDLPSSFVEKWRVHTEEDDLPELDKIKVPLVSDTKEEEFKLLDVEDELSEDELSEDELSEDEGRVDLDADVVFNKEDEEDNIFSSEDEGDSSDEELEDEDSANSSSIVVPSSDEEDETVCPPGCDCVNCEAEREEA
jgi:hypothetical protein